MITYNLSCPKCKNTQDFRKEVTRVVAITTISPLVDEDEDYFEDISDTDIYPYPEEIGGVIEIYCNKCDFCFTAGPDCNDQGLLVKHCIEKGWLKVVGK